MKREATDWEKQIILYILKANIDKIIVFRLY